MINDPMIDQLDAIITTRLEGRIAQTLGATAAVADLPVPLGAEVEIDTHLGAPIPAEVIGFQDNLTLVYPLKEMAGVRRGERVRLRKTAPWLRVGDGLLGHIVDADGKSLDGRPIAWLPHRVPRHRPAPAAIERPTIDTPIATGLRAIDGLLTCGRGQRLGIFAGAGVGKSTMLGMIARNTEADVKVIALVGERGREVNDFVQTELGANGLQNSIVVVATSDEPAPVRIRAAQTATAIAEFFRDQGQDVLLLMDSITRIAMAQREIGLARDEPTTTRGYPPSVYSLLPQLVERAGRTDRGSITAFYSVLVEGDDPHEPISDTMRGLLDGHISLSRKLASEGHYPAIDVLESVSRLMPAVTSPEHRAAAMRARQWLSTYREHEDVIALGAYQPGANDRVDEAIAMRGPLRDFLRQPVQQRTSLDDTIMSLRNVAGEMVHG